MLMIWFRQLGAGRVAYHSTIDCGAHHHTHTHTHTQVGSLKGDSSVHGVAYHSNSNSVKEWRMAPLRDSIVVTKGEEWAAALIWVSIIPSSLLNQSINQSIIMVMLMIGRESHSSETLTISCFETRESVTKQHILLWVIIHCCCSFPIMFTVARKLVGSFLGYSSSVHDAVAWMVSVSNNNSNSYRHFVLVIVCDAWLTFVRQTLHFRAPTMTEW